MLDTSRKFPEFFIFSLFSRRMLDGGTGMDGTEKQKNNNSDTLIRDIPYIVHESITVKQERTIKRLMTALVFAIALMFLSNAIWLWAWMQYDYVSEESTVDVDSRNGIATYVGGSSGVITYGTGDGQSQAQNKDTP